MTTITKLMLLLEYPSIGSITIGSSDLVKNCFFESFKELEFIVGSRSATLFLRSSITPILRDTTYEMT